MFIWFTSVKNPDKIYGALSRAAVRLNKPKPDLKKTFYNVTVDIGIQAITPGEVRAFRSIVSAKTPKLLMCEAKKRGFKISVREAKVLHAVNKIMSRKTMKQFALAQIPGKDKGGDITEAKF